MKTKDSASPVVVYSGSTWEAELVKSLMENAGIQTFLWDENTGTLAPWYTAPGGAGSVKVVVSETDYVRARHIVKEYERHLKE